MGTRKLRLTINTTMDNDHVATVLHKTSIYIYIHGTNSRHTRLELSNEENTYFPSRSFIKNQLLYSNLQKSFSWIRCVCRPLQPQQPLRTEHRDT